MSRLSYKGYWARIEFDAEDACFVGHVAGIDDVVGFHADTVPDLIAAFHVAVDDYVETCRKLNKSPDKPFTGNVMLRLTPETHASAARAAQLSGKSLNQWSEEALRREAELELLSG